MEIKDLKLPSKVMIAPMAGVSNKAFRQVLRKYTDGLICCEMISDKGLHYNNERTLKMADIGLEEGIISLQIFGSDIQTMVEAAQYIDKETNAKIIDINMGCPVKKVLKTGGGSQLLLEPKKVKEIVSAVVQAVDKPVSVKIRTGFDQEHLNYLEIGKIIEDAGADMIVLHGRTRSQFYEGKADWNAIKELKKTLSIPVIGNGDIFSVDDAIEMLEQTNCDGIMIGRGIQGNPWLARDIEHYLATGERLPEVSASEKVEQALEHLDLLLNDLSEKHAVAQMRSQLAWYLKGLPQSSLIKNKLNQAVSVSEVKEILYDYLDIIQ